MTVEEMLAREAIRDTMARYTMSGDRLRIDDYVACFTEDGIMEASETPGECLFRHVGRDAIRAWQQGWRDSPATGGGGQGATFVRHHMSTSKIDLTGPGTAVARTYWVAWTDIGPDHNGYYVDDFLKVGDLWLIAHRRARMDWRSPASIFRPL